MANPVAAHTFDFVRVYLSTRTGGAPGSGAWSVATTLFSGLTDPTNFGTASTFSAGALAGDLSENRGVVCATSNNSNTDLTFLGNGSPDTPIRISFTGQHSGITGDGEGYWCTTQGAWSNGSALYAALVNFDSLSGNLAVTIIKSTDNGITWAIQDETNGATGFGTEGRRSCIQRVDNYLYVFTAVGGGNYQIFPFNMDTDLWETESTSIHIPNFVSVGRNPAGGTEYWSNGLIKFLNGDFLVLYNTSTPAAIARVLSGGLAGTWGAEIPLPGQENANSLIDSALISAHIFTYDNSGDVGSEVHYSTIAQDGTLVGDITTIPAVVGDSSDGVGHSSIQNGMILVPRDDAADFDNAVWVATLPVTAFSKELLPIPPGESGVIKTLAIDSLGSGYAAGDTGTIDGGEAGFLATYRVIAIASNVITSYALNAQGSGYAPGDTGTVAGGGVAADYQIISVDMSGGVTDFILTFLGSGYSISSGNATTTSGGGIGFTVDVLSVANGIRNIDVADFGGGYSVASNVGTTTGGAQPGSGSGLTFNIVAVQGKTPSCAYMMFPNGYSLSATPLTLPCPLVTSPAVVGQPFTETLIASGGTPPYTYAVAIGYSLPPGLSLDPVTGIISGIPTEAGTFDVAYTVTDSLGNTATTLGTCPIPIGNPPTGGPCSAPGTNPALDSYLELRKVLVAWKKETHLPVRGKS